MSQNPRENCCYLLLIRKKRTVKKIGEIRSQEKNAAGLLVSVNYFGFGLGASYNYNLIKKLDIGSNFLYSNANLKGDIDGLTEKYDFSTLSLSIGARYFVFMNFYAGINVAYSSASGEYGFSGENLDKSQTIAPFSSSLIHTDFLIGTKWRIFKRFYVGADWVGYGLKYYQVARVPMQTITIAQSLKDLLVRNLR